MTGLRGLAIVAGIALSIVAPASLAAAETQLPFNDPNVSGQIGFCDKSNRPVTSGSIGDVPFVWKAVSTVAAPPAYVGPEGKATLYAYSPIKNVSPGQWSPYQLSSSAYYSNPKHPMVQSTFADAPLEYQTTGFPPTLDGLVQIRMLFSAPNRVPLTSPYPAAVVRVKGDRWTLVSGDRSPECSAGKSVSVAAVRMPKQQPTAPPTWAANAPTKVKPTPSSTAAAPTASSSPTVTPPTQDSATNTNTNTNADADDSPEVAAATVPVAAPRQQSSGISPTVAVVLVAVGVIGAGAVGLILGRRSKPKSATSSSPNDPRKG